MKRVIFSVTVVLKLFRFEKFFVGQLQDIFKIFTEKSGGYKEKNVPNFY